MCKKSAVEDITPTRFPYPIKFIIWLIQLSNNLSFFSPFDATYLTFNVL